jgi:HAD superfamily hydrolase (TIGR01509 family)
VRRSLDPFDVLRYSAKVSPEDARHVEAAFRAHEVEAVQLTQPTPGAHELIRAWKATGRPLAIVSNNSAAAIEVYAARFALTDMVDYVSARTSADPTLLKPSPHLITSAVRRLEVPAFGSIMLGDSVMDIEAAVAAGVHAIGYANKFYKIAMFAKIGVDATTQTLADLVFV